MLVRYTYDVILRIEETDAFDDKCTLDQVKRAADRQISYIGPIVEIKRGTVTQNVRVFKKNLVDVRLVADKE